MRKETWRRIGYILTFAIVAAISFFVGHIIGSMQTAEFIIDMAIDKGMVIGVNKAELFEYFLKLTT